MLKPFKDTLLGRTITLLDGRRKRLRNRFLMGHGHTKRRFKLFNGVDRTTLPPATLPIDWTKGSTLSFVMDGNDQYGDCYVAQAEHIDNAWTGTIGTESVFKDSDTISWYEQLSGGDNGLSEGQIMSAWEKGLPGITQATILDYLDIDPTNQPLMAAGMFNFGPISFTCSLFDKWYSSFVEGGTWDAVPGASPDLNDGHAIAFTQALPGKYRLQTWGSWCWITQAGINVCDAAATIMFSIRMFNPQGYAANGLHISYLAPLWVQAGGSNKVLAAVSQFPPASGPPVPVPPGPPPTPPGPPVSIGTMTLSKVVSGNYELTTSRHHQTPDISFPQQTNPGTFQLETVGRRTEGVPSKLNLTEILALINLVVSNGPVIQQIVQAVEAKNWILVESLGLGLAPGILTQILSILGVSLPGK